MGDVERCFDTWIEVKRKLSKLEWTDIRFEEDYIDNSVSFNIICGKYRASVYPDPDEDGHLGLYVEAYENEFEYIVDPTIFLDYDTLMQELKRISDM